MSINIDTLEEKRKKLSAKWSHYPNILWHGSKGIQMADHSLIHTQNLLGLADNLLTLLSKDTLKPIEFLVLYYALWLHDIGHRGNENYQEPIDIRDFHGVISGLLLLEDSFKNCSTIYELEKYIALPVALISMYHQRGLPFNGSDRVRLVTRTAKEFPKELDPNNQLMERIKYLFSKSPSDLPNEYVVLLFELSEIITNVLPPYEVEIREVLLKEGSTKIDLNFLTALLRFIDTIDFRYNRIGSEKEVLARKQCTAKELAFYNNQKKFIIESLTASKLTNTTKKFCQDLLTEWQKNKDMLLEDVDNKIKNTFDRVKNTQPSKKLKKVDIEKAKECFLDWRRWMRYLAFLRDQSEYYYPLHKSILNVYFALSNDGFLNIIFDTEIEDESIFKKCCKRVKTQIKKEWNIGAKETSVGETLENRGVKIQKFVFKNSYPCRIKCFSFPDGKPINCN